VSRWEPSDLLSDFWPVPRECFEDAMVTLSRIPWLDSWKYDDVLERVSWTLKNNDGRDCAHLRVKRQVAKSVALHAALDWEG
jgi:hypothetical protein